MLGYNPKQVFLQVKIEYKSPINDHTSFSTVKNK